MRIMLLMFMTSLLCEQAYSQTEYGGTPGHLNISHSHSPSCGLTGGVCYGWAMGRAAGFDTNSACNPATMIPRQCSNWQTWTISSQLWQYFDDPYLDVSGPIIINFGPHVVYGSGALNDPLEIFASHVVAEGQSNSNITLTRTGEGKYRIHIPNVMDYTSIGYWRGRTFEAIGRNIFEVGTNTTFQQGTISIAGNVGQSPRVASNLYVNTTYKVIASSPQEYPSGYYQVFNRWVVDGAVVGMDLEFSFQVPAPNAFDAHFYETAPIVFVSAPAGAISVGGTVHTSTYTHLRRITPGNSPPLSAEALAFHNDNVLKTTYQFVRWNSSYFGTYNYAASITVYPTIGGTTFTAEYSQFKPLPPDNVLVGGNVGQNVTVTWDIHPNTNVVRYLIWRRVKKKGQLEQESQIATINSRTTNQFIDNTYTVSSGYNDILYYDVRPQFTTGETSDPSYVGGIFGEGGFVERAQSDQIELENRGPLEPSLSIFPNPFNPSTEISFVLPEPSSVKIVVMDLLGREVVTLVSREYAQGYHRTRWNGADSEGRGVGTGIYLCRIDATGQNGRQFTKVLKMALTK